MPVPMLSVFRCKSFNPILPLFSILACGVSCHKDCRIRLAVECRKRTQSTCHEYHSPQQSRSFSVPAIAQPLLTVQHTGTSTPPYSSLFSFMFKSLPGYLKLTVVLKHKDWYSTFYSLLQLGMVYFANLVHNISCQ